MPHRIASATPDATFLAARRLLAAAALAASVSLAPPAQAAPAEPPPDEGECPEVRLEPTGDGDFRDQPGVQLEEGMVLEIAQLLLLKQLLPSEIWQHREVFFHEGMKMEIGACHRRYRVPAHFRDATAKYAGKVSIDGKGNIEDYTAGIPFRPEQIDLDAKDAAQRWAWNLEKRYRGAGHRGDFRITDLPSSMGGTLEYEGDWFLLRTQGRTDLASRNYREKEGDDRLFASGGSFREPFNARHLAWRQFRAGRSERRYQEPDDIFVYVPTMRKMRRAAAVWVDGLYLPRYTLAGDDGGGAIPFGGELGGSINPTAGSSIAITQAMKRGLTGISLRPNAYLWRHHGVQEVVAPLNGKVAGWPLDPDRSFGPSGLSLASDRWDVRQAIILEGALRERNESVRTLTVYVDTQTLQPLYWITRTSGRRLLDIGILVHRHSDDYAPSRSWKNGDPAQLFEPVAASFFNALEGRGGWRRESYALDSTPPTHSQARQMLSATALERGR